MNYRIELFRGPEQEFFGTLPFMPIVQESVERLLGQSLQQAMIHVLMLNVPEDAPIGGMPIIENVIPDYGYAYIRVYEAGMIMYQHPHPLSDIITQTLQTKLRVRYPEEQMWGFRVDVPGMPQRAAYRMRPQVEGGVAIHSYAPGEGPLFAIRRLADPDVPVRTLADYGISPDNDEQAAAVKVLVPQRLQADLAAFRLFSHEVEEGGFLIGKVYRESEEENTYIVEVSDALTAEYTGASLLHFTFTGDSFAGVKRTLRQNHPEDRMVGWYHTHLFPATETFGLSSIDFVLHFSTFTIPWQIAGLVNIDGNQRTLRFYVRQGDDMVLCPMWVINER